MTRRYRIQLQQAFTKDWLYLRTVVLDQFSLISIVKTTNKQEDALAFPREEAEKMRDKLERGHGYAVSFEEVT